jgi:hypothetical protein
LHVSFAVGAGTLVRTLQGGLAMYSKDVMAVDADVGVAERMLNLYQLQASNMRERAGWMLYEVPQLGYGLSYELVHVGSMLVISLAYW